MGSHKRLGSIVAGAALLMVFVGLPVSASPAPSRVRLSTLADVDAYLATRGISPSTAVVERGLHNYAGPHCPGAGWTCTGTSKPVVQMASSHGGNVFDCETSWCVVVQTPAAGDNTATCKESGTATQYCSITQTNDTGTNKATVDLEVSQNDGTSQSVQQTTYIAQTNNSGSNTASVTNVAKQTESGSSATQNEEAIQQVSVDQSAQTGNNSLDVDQKQTQGQSSTTPSIHQSQNPTPGGTFTPNTSDCNGNGEPGTTTFSSTPNEFAVLCEVSSSGTNKAKLTQTIDQDQKTKAITGSQLQSSPPTSTDPFNGGLGGGLGGYDNQHSTGVSTASNTQTENQSQKAPQGAGVSQTQFGPLTLFTLLSQDSNPNDKTTMEQASTQNASTAPNADQHEDLEIGCHSSGNCNADQSTNVDGLRTTNSQSGPGPFLIAITCTPTSTDSPTTSGSGVTCAPTTEFLSGGGG